MPQSLIAGTNRLSPEWSASLLIVVGCGALNAVWIGENYE